MAANTADLGKLLAQGISGTIAEYGLSLPELYVENISLPAAVEAALDRRTSMGVVGDLGRYTQFQAAEALSHPGGAGGAMAQGLGAGLGLSIGQQVAQQVGPWGARPASPAPAAAAPVAPPPPPVEHVWHLAKDGQTSGPYSKARLGRMVTEGGLTRDTYVWTQGQDGWQRAGEVRELAQLFTVMPPPPPPGA